VREKMPGMRTEAMRRGKEFLDRIYIRIRKELGLLTTIKRWNLWLLSLAFRWRMFHEACEFIYQPVWSSEKRLRQHA
jgi:hypothetical protein